MLSWQRIIYYLSLAVVEATPPTLLLAITGHDAWGALLLVVLAGGLADWVVLRRLRPERQGLALAGLGLLAALWAAKVSAFDNASLLSGWGDALGALVTFSDPRAGATYLALLVGLYCFWRGTRLSLHDSVSLHRLFRLATVMLMLIVGVGFLGSGGRPGLSELASTEVLSFFAVGLLAIALAAASDERETELQRMGWRGMLTLAGAIVLVLCLGVLVSALFGHEAAQIVRVAWQAFIFVIALIIAPLLYLLATVFEWLFRLLHLERIFDIAPPPVQPPAADLPPAAQGVLGIFPPWVQVLIQAVLAIVPVLIILLLLYFLRSRRRRSASPDEERVSLWSWSGLADDLLGLLGKLRPAASAGGLRDALARLRGTDPASRIRRSYIRLLLLGEAREQPRNAPQTAREYGPVASAMVPGAAQPVATLTDAYERARYNPAGTSPADADAAERAWAAIEQASARKEAGDTRRETR